MASLVAALLCAALVPSAAFRAGPLALLQGRPGACLDLQARQTAGSIPPLRCPLLATAMSETSTDVGDVDQREWEQWTAKFAGKFVLRSGTATGTSRRAAVQSESEDVCLAIVQLDAGRCLTAAEVCKISDNAKLSDIDLGMDALEGLEKVAAKEAMRHRDDEEETKTLLYLLGDGRVEVKAQVPRDPVSVLDQLTDQTDDSLDDSRPQQEYIPYWVQLWPSALVLADEFASGRISVADKKLLELSAGLGLPAVTAKVMGAERVMLTEFDDKCLPHIQRNAQVNGVEVETTLFDWFQPQQSEVMLDIDEWDTICLADVMYEDIFVQPVAKAVRNLLRQNRNSTVIFVDPLRKNLAQFCEQLEGMGLQVRQQLRRVTIHEARLDTPLKTEDHCICILTISL